MCRVGEQLRAAMGGIMGYYVMKWGGGRYTSVGWFLNKEQAEEEVRKILATGCWGGMPPRVEPDDKEETNGD